MILHPDPLSRGTGRQHSPVVVRAVDWGADTTTVADLVEAYLRQTEREKTEHDSGEKADPGPLPLRYRAEVADPRIAYAGCAVLLAVIDQRPAGVIVVAQDRGDVEIKRLFTVADARGHGVGSALLDAALSLDPTCSVRLTVWEWRGTAIGLYESRGFIRVPSWDDRPGLVCMVRNVRSAKDVV